MRTDKFNKMCKKINTIYKIKLKSDLILLTGIGVAHAPTPHSTDASERISENQPQRDIVRSKCVEINMVSFAATRC